MYVFVVRKILILSKRFACLVLMQSHKNFIILVHNNANYLMDFNTEGCGLLTSFLAETIRSRYNDLSISFHNLF